MCSEACRRERARVRSRARSEALHLAATVKCAECDKSFEPAYGVKRRKFCSELCARRNHRRARRSAERAKIRAQKVEAVNPFKVFERDGWRCQICGKDTPRGRRGTRYRNAPELDHRVPLGSGGEHSYANTQCACRECNQAKSNNSETGQLPLIA